MSPSVLALAPKRAYARILPLLSLLLLLGCSAGASAPPSTADRQLLGLEAAVRWPAPDDAVVFSLASRYLATGQDEAGYRTFGERAAAAPDRPLFLALQGLFQARLAPRVFLLRRLAWVAEATGRLDRAAAHDGLSRLVRGLTLARLPARFHRAEDAVADLRWALGGADSPLQQGIPGNIAAGLRRAAWQALASAEATAGRPEASAEALRRSGAASLDSGAPLSVPYSLSARDGFRFGPPRLRSMGDRVHVATGYDFADIGFVVTSAGVVAIDAGTTPETAAAALAAFRRQVTEAPLRAVIVTHAHWDHVGGLAALAGPGVEVVGSDRYREELARERQAGAGRRWFFGEGFQMAATLAYAPTRPISARTTLRYGDTDFELLPARGGETEDALLVNLPQRGVCFVGDAFMPYLGAPFLAEGSPDGLLDTIRTLEALGPRRLLHGHAPLTDFYTAEALPALGQALAELRDAADEAVRAGKPLDAILDENRMPAVLAQHPEAAMGYLLMRDQLVTRLQRQHTGYWQAGGEGMEVISSADRARALALLAGGEERAFTRAAGKLLEGGEEALALELARAGLATFPASGELAALRDRALDGLRARNAQLNPFKFILYSEMRGAELPPLREPEGAL